jgi:phosphocarrier protein HPr
MTTISTTVGSSVGLHARPAALIAEAAAALASSVTLAVPGGQPVVASSALMIMTLGAGYGDTVEVAGDDEDDVRLIADLVARDLDD